MERKAFPRGGAVEEETDEPRKNTNSHWLPTQKKKKSKKSRNDSESDPEADYELEERLQKDAETKVTIFDLKYKDVQEKMKLLGRVAAIYDHCVEVYLPGAIGATVPLHSIIEMIGSTGPDRFANPPKLTDLFRIDQLVITQVTNVIREKSKQGKGTTVYVTVNPKIIYQGQSHRDVAQVGRILQAYVRGVEDHGYILDCGIQDLHIFLNKKDCVKYCSRFNNGNPLVKGQMVRAVVIKANSANVRSQVEVSIEPGKVFRAEAKVSEFVDDASQLLPGMRFKLEVTKRLSNGLAVNFDEFEGFVIDRNIPHKLKDTDVGDSFMGCLLYVSKPLNVPMLSLVHSVVDPNLAPVREFNFGDIVKSAVVESESSGGVGLLLNKKTGTRGRVPRSYKKNAEKEASSDAIHKIGNTVRCRILDFDNLSETYMCTTLESALKERFFSASDVPVGSIVTATVTGFTEKALTISVGAVTGYIHWYHASDTPVLALTDKFNVGQKIKGRVLKNNGKKIDVTAKESLLSKECAVLKSYEDAAPRQVYPGTVLALRGEGVVVGFFGGVRGVIPYTKLDASFKKLGQGNIGRLVKCTVVSCKDEKLVLALSDSADSEVSVGFECSPIVAAIDTKNRALEVVSGSTIRGSIPVRHLHDNEKLAGEIFHTYSLGDVVEDALCFTSKPVVFSTRGSVRRFFESEHGQSLIEKGPESLQPGVIVPCFVKSATEKEITLSTPLANSNFVHRVRVKHLQDVKDVQEGDYFPLKVQDAAKKFYDQDVLDALGDEAQISTDFLSDILDGNKRLKEHAKKSASPLCAFKVGQTVSGPVESTDSGFKVCMPNGVKGHVNSFCTDENPTVGEIVQGKVIYIDYERSELILSLQESVISKLVAKKSAANAEIGAALTGRIVRGFPEFYLAMVTTANGLRRAFIPKHVYPSRKAPLAVSPGIFGKELEFTVVQRYGNALLCVPAASTGKWKPKHGTANAEERTEKTAEGQKKSQEKTKRKRRKRKISGSSDQSDSRIVDNSSPKRQKDKPIAESDSQSPKLKTSPQKTLKVKSPKTMKSPKKSKKLIAKETEAKAQKKAKKLGTSKKTLEGLPEKLKNKKLLAALVESVTGGGGKSPLVRSSDRTKKSLVKTKLGRNKLILKGARKPAKRLKISGKAKSA